MSGNEEELFSHEGHALLGAAFEVYNQPGSGFLEEVYPEALEIELTERGIPLVSEPRLAVFYEERPPRKHFEADQFVHSEIVVELKAARATAPEHEAQLINELKATRKRVGYLINFGAAPHLYWSRRVF